MSNNVRLQALLDAVARASRPLKAIHNASLSLEGEIGESQAALRALDEQAARVDGFRKTSSQLTMTGQALALARQQTAALARELKNTQNPTREQNDALTAARQSAAALKLEYNNLRQSVQRQRGELAQAGINTRTLAADERRLRKSIGEKRSSSTDNERHSPGLISSRSGSMPFSVATNPANVLPRMCIRSLAQA